MAANVNKNTTKQAYVFHILDFPFFSFFFLFFSLFFLPVSRFKLSNPRSNGRPGADFEFHKTAHFRSLPSYSRLSSHHYLFPQIHIPGPSVSYDNIWRTCTYIFFSIFTMSFRRAIIPLQKEKTIGNIYERKVKSNRKRKRNENQLSQRLIVH